MEIKVTEKKVTEKKVNGKKVNGKKGKLRIANCERYAKNLIMHVIERK